MEKLENTLEKVIKKYPGVTYSIREADTTNSAYVRFYYRSRKRTVRVSDHPTKKLMPTTIGKTNLERFFINNIEKLKQDCVFDLFDDIEKGREC